MPFASVYIYHRIVIIDNAGVFTVTRYNTQDAILNLIDRLMGVFPIMILRGV